MAKVDTFVEKCEIYLRQHWQEILETESPPKNDSFLDDEHLWIKDKIALCLRSKTKSYRYVLPTQLLSKCVNPDLDCRSLQASFDSKGSFDARTIAHKVVVPFDKDNHNVLGGSNEPYVNNPLRCDSISKANRARQKNKQDWDRLIEILDYVQAKDHPKFTTGVFRQVLHEILIRLSDVRVSYPTPNRISLEQTIKLINEFVMEKSGGERLEAVVSSLLKTISQKLELFDDVRREKVNAPDAASGLAGDVECWHEGKIVMLVEVKDRELNLIQLDATIDSARSKKIREILFIAQKGIRMTDRELAEQRIRQEFSSGQNVYITSLQVLALGVLIFLGEEGRVDFIRRIGLELDDFSSPIQHRKAWASMLKEI